MILVEGRLCGLGIRRGRIFGSAVGAPTVTVNLLVASIFWVGERGHRAFAEAARGLAHDPDWWSENHPSVRSAKRQAAPRLAKKYAATIRDTVRRLNDELSREQEMVHRLGLENATLRDAFRLLAAEERKPE